MSDDLIIRVIADALVETRATGPIGAAKNVLTALRANDIAVMETPGPLFVIPEQSTVAPKQIICWLVAYYTDWSGMAVFRDEIDALRHAVANNMHVFPLDEGDIRDQMTARRAP